MALALIGVVAGLALLIWGAGLFVDGSATVARHFRIPPLLIGMVIVGFGTSAPELVVSALAASQGNLGIALGNAYGSNIVNIALILGLTAVISPIAVHSQVIRRELPILILVTGLAAWQIRDGAISRLDALVLLAVFTALLVWSIRQGLQKKPDTLGSEMDRELKQRAMPLHRAVFGLVAGLALLIVSSRILVWGAVQIARSFGISDLIVGLTIVAIGTSLPELASSVIASRKGEHDLALGNIVGSNLFNTLAVVGIAGAFFPMTVAAELFSRDVVVMGGLTLLLFVTGYGFRGPGRINRFEGVVLLACYAGYVAYLVTQVLASANSDL